MLELYGNTLSDFAVAGVFGVGVVVFGVSLRSLLVFCATRFAARFAGVLVPVIRSFSVVFFCFVAVFAVFFFFLAVPPSVDSVLRHAFVIFLALQVLFVVFRLIDFGVHRYSETLDRDRKMLVTMLPSVGLVLKVVITLFVAVFALSNVGIDVTALVAGLGIGGLAIAFAFQKILGDLFSAFVVFFDRPFSVGDFITAAGESGTVERVGIKSTCLRAFSGERVVIPNSDLVNAVVHNNADFPSRRAVLSFFVSYDTGVDTLATVPDLIEQSVLSHEKVRFSHAKIRELDAYGVVFEAVYHVDSGTYNEHLAIRHAVYVSVLSSFSERGIVPGYPVIHTPRA